MKLRFVEREIHTPIYGSVPDIAEVKTVNVLQYYACGNGEWYWVDVPLEVEEKNNG